MAWPQGQTAGKVLGSSRTAQSGAPIRPPARAEAHLGALEGLSHDGAIGAGQDAAGVGVRLRQPRRRIRQLCGARQLP